MSNPAPHSTSSCPGLSRASTSVAGAGEVVDGRDKPGHDGGNRWRTVRIVAAILAAVCFIAIGVLAAWVVSLGPLPLQQARQISQTVVDRNGKLLRAYAMADGRWRLPVDARINVDPTYLKLLFAYEDKRFYSHAGVDPLAMARATIQLFSRGHIVSGGTSARCPPSCIRWCARSKSSGN